MNQHLYFFPSKITNPITNTNLKQNKISQIKVLSNQSYSKRAMGGEFTNNDERPSINKEKSDFSLYSFTTNNEPPQKQISKVAYYEKTISYDQRKNELKAKIKNYKENYEILSEKYNSLLKSIDDSEKKNVISKTENQSKDLNNQVKSLETEIKVWKKNYEDSEKQKFYEIAQMKLLFRNSIISSESDIPEENLAKEENLRIVSDLKHKIDVMIEKNLELNKILNRSLDELGFLRIESQVGQDEYFNKILSKMKSEKLENEKKLLCQLNHLRNEISVFKHEISNESNLKESLKNNNERSNNPFTNGEEIIFRRLAFLENKNKELENELENIKLQYWNMEKKMQYDSLMCDDVKFTDQHLENLVTKARKENQMKEEELIDKLKTLEIKKQNLKKKSVNKEFNTNKTYTSYKFLKK